MRSIILMVAAASLAVTIGCTDQNNQRELAEAPRSAPRTNLYPLTSPPPGSVQSLQGYAPTRISAYGSDATYGVPTDMAAGGGYDATYASTTTYGGSYAAPTYSGGYTTQPASFTSGDPFAATTPAGGIGTANYCPPGSAYCTVEEVTRYSNPVVPIQDPPVVINNAPNTFANYGGQPYGATTTYASTTYGTPNTYAPASYTPPPTSSYNASSSYRSRTTTSTSRRSPSLSANTAYTRQPTPPAADPNFTSVPNVYNPYTRQPRLGRGEGTADWAIPLSALGSSSYSTTTTTTSYAAPTTYATTTYAAPATTYGTTTTYGVPATTYGTPTTYGAPATTYGTPATYGAPAPTYGAPATYGTPAPTPYAPPLSMNSSVNVPASYNSSVAGQTVANMGAREFKLVPALDVPPGNHPNDAGPSQWFEVVRPDNGPVRIGRMSSTCVCVGVRIPKRQYAAGERILIEARMLSKPPRNNLTYGIYVNIVEPTQTVVDADVTLRY